MASEVVRRVALLLTEGAGNLRAGSGLFGVSRRLAREFRILQTEALDRAFFATNHGAKFIKGGR